MNTGGDRAELDATGFSCDSSLHSDVCVSNEPVRIHMRSLTVYLSPNQSLPPINRTVHPYARKEDSTALSLVARVEILRGVNNKPPPPCDVTHDVSAVIFSSGGFIGNLFHEFNEIIIPLFLTTHHFQSHLRFIVTDFQAWWVSKYHRILTHLSHHDVINPAEDGKVHCFQGAVIGLKYHDNLACNTSDIPGGYSMNDFRRFLRDSFSLKIKNVAEIEKPVLRLISRPKTRVFLNENEIVGLAMELGFQVVTATPNQMSNLDKFSSEINSCSVLLGVHGAGLTNAVFMPEGAVLLQVVPLGLEWPSTFYYAQTVGEMNVRYLEYRINPEESSLLAKYGPDHPVITDPQSIHRQGYYAARAVYVDGQNLKLDLLRFRETLEQALKLIGGSSP
ncbi:Glycosyltransferase AER61 [Macleaya cordata]|uniref:Glycosyltransferase AER61 n=1 Tax=Macleaya cordata TaxID=56857 RepID=A0A200QGX9_MACCD|nr:Glycosyltransferase AER61 [Macleaya cordata]